MVKTSNVLAKLRSGKPAICTKMNLTDSRVIDLIGMIGFDCVWLCNEHIPNDWSSLENQIRAAKMHNMDTLIRVAKGSYSDYIKPLEADATGIMVPHVFSEQEAKQVARSTKFAPIGRRPIDGGNSDGRYCLISTREYAEFANRERFVMIQIEDPEPMEELDAICSVPGIDIIFFGPLDYSQGIGRLGDTSHPDVLSAKKRVIETARRHGKFAGCPASVDTAQETIDSGVQFVCIGADVIALGLYFKDIREKLMKKGLL